MLEIKQTPMGGNITAFLDVVSAIYKGDPYYVRPLDMDLGDRLNPKKNPFFQHGEGTIFTAHKQGRCVGRITAQIDREHLDRYKDATGFFGFFDTMNDPVVSSALLGRAESWLRDRGMRVSQGPMSLCINEETGCLIEGFNSRPFVMMPHHHPYQGELIEASGYAKAKDLFAWRYDVGELNSRTKRAREDIRSLPNVTSRPLAMAHITRDVETMVDIFNDAWNENWGFVPMTQPEVHKLAYEFKLILIPELTRLVSIDGEPAAVAIAIPNLNEMIYDLNGKLFPLGLPKLLYRLKVVGPKSARLILLGIRKKYRAIRKYAPLASYLYAEMNDATKKRGITLGELSWTLEDNSAVNAGIRLMGAQLYKKYRVYSKSI